jgi:hypothetical protein
MAFAFWLSVFFADPKRPVSVEERADRLAAENYASGSLFAPTPASPAHWSQRLVLLDEQSGRRHPVAREASAVLLTATAGSARTAAILAFGLAAGGLVWLLRGPLGLSLPFTSVITVAAMLASARSQDWQMVDPTPWIILAASACCLGAWWCHRAHPDTQAARLLGVGLGILLLSAPALAVVVGLAVVIDWRVQKNSRPRHADANRHTAPLRPLLAQIGLVLLLPVLALLARNQLVTGNPFVTPSALYRAENVTAPAWFWQTEGAPQDGLDYVIERYDQLVALPSAQIATPAYRSLLDTVLRGSHFFGGAGLALLAAISALLLPARLTRPAWLLVAGTTAAVFLRFAAPLDWWLLALPACALLAGLGLQACQRVSQRLPSRVLCALAVTQLAFLPAAPADRPAPEEYTFADNWEQIRKKIRETSPGPHLVFVQLDDTAPARPEAAALPRDWSGLDVLLARQLGPEKDAALVAAMPERTAWRIIVFRDRIGLQRWTPPSAATAPDAPAESDASSTPAESAKSDVTPEPAPPVARD